MANTINKETQLSARLLVLLQEPTLWEVMANTSYQWELKEQWDTVKVQNFPLIEWDSNNWDIQALWGENITVKDWALGKSDIKVDQIWTINIKIKDIEKELSNLNLESGLLQSIHNWKKRLVSRFIQKITIDSAWFEVWTSASKIALTKDNILDVLGKMAAKLDDNNVPAEQRYLFIKPELTYLIVNARGFDWTSVSAEMRKKGVVWEILWFTVVKDSTMPANKACACDKNSVHYISKFDKVKVVWDENNRDWFWSNILWELIYWGKVLTENKKRICVLHYELS